MRKYLFLLSFTFLITTSLFSQNYTSNIKLLVKKEKELKKLEKDFCIDSMTISSLVYNLKREISSIQYERDSVQKFLLEIKPQNNVYGLIKKDISITNRVDKQDYIFDQGDTVQLVNHSHHTYTLMTDNDQLLTINTKYIKPLEGKKRTTSLIAQYQIRLEDYEKTVASSPTNEWYNYDINRVKNEKKKYEEHYIQLVEELNALRNEIVLLKKEISKKTTS